MQMKYYINKKSLDFADSLLHKKVKDINYRLYMLGLSVNLE